MRLVVRIWFWLLFVAYIYILMRLVDLWPARPMLGAALASAASIVAAAVILLALHEWRSGLLVSLGRVAAIAWVLLGIFALVIFFTRPPAPEIGFLGAAFSGAVFNILPGTLAWLVLRQRSN